MPGAIPPEKRLVRTKLGAAGTTFGNVALGGDIGWGIDSAIPPPAHNDKQTESKAAKVPYPSPIGGSHRFRNTNQPKIHGSFNSDQVRTSAAGQFSILQEERAARD
jgi:hypothetical protein